MSCPLSFHWNACMHACKSLQSCLTLCDPMDCSPPGSFVQYSPGKNTGVGCHALLQRIFLIQGSNPCLLYLPYWQEGLLPLAPPGKPLHWNISCLFTLIKSFFFKWIRRHRKQTVVIKGEIGGRDK